MLKEEVFPLIGYLESSDEISSVDILSNETLINESDREAVWGKD